MVLLWEIIRVTQPPAAKRLATERIKLFCTKVYCETFADVSLEVAPAPSLTAMSPMSRKVLLVTWVLGFPTVEGAPTNSKEWPLVSQKRSLVKTTLAHCLQDTIALTVPPIVLPASLCTAAYPSDGTTKLSCPK